MTGRPRLFSAAPYRASIAVVLLCGALVAALLYREGRQAEEQRAEAEFARRVTARHAIIREVLQRYTESLYGLAALFALDHEISRQEFIEASARLQQRVSGVLAVEWAPLVTREQRADVEAAMRQAYPQRGFEFVEFDANGRRRRAADRPFHYPICYVEPLAGNDVVLGYDLTSSPTRPFLERARDTRQMAVTNQFSLAQDNSDRLGLVIICPVYRADGSAQPAAGSARERTVFAGFVQYAFHVDELLDTASRTVEDPILDILFIDADEKDRDRRVLHVRSARAGATPQRIDEPEFVRSAPFVRELPLSVGERSWKAIYRPRAGWMEAQRTWAPLRRSSAIMVLSALLAGLVSVIGRRTETIGRQVQLRTAELAESRRQLANLLHALPGMAYRATYNRAFTLVFASEGALALTGWPAEDFVTGSVHVRTLIHPDDVERVRTETRRLLAEHGMLEVQYRLRTRDGGEKWVLSRGRGVYDPEGKLTYIEGIVIDITDAKRAEEARLAIERKLLETQKLESLGLLAGGVAHDFNNLLSAILGNAGLGRMSLPPGSPVDAHLRAIETASTRAAELCRQMLAYAGKGRLVVERVDLSAMVEELLPLVRVSLAPAANLALDLARDLPALRADATQVRQVIMNLVLNAGDALAGRKGEITIRTAFSRVDRALLARCVTGQLLPEGNYLALDVTDTGCGMTPEVRTKIFDPFFTTKVSGRGLGLAAVLGIVRSHNGALLVESEPGRGSTFRLFLPAALGDAGPASSAKPAAAPSRRFGGKVLVIDDEEPVRYVMVELLKSFGLTAEAAGDGATGITAFTRDPAGWTLVIIDQRMPGMTGEETLAAIRRLRADVPVLLMSGQTEAEALSRMRASGGRLAFIAKPFNRDAFEQKLRELIA